MRSRFEHRWTRGFEVSEIVALDGDRPGYRVKRRSDGAILPVTFDDEDVREERRRQYPWWG